MQPRAWCLIAATFVVVSIAVARAEDIQQEIATAKQGCEQNTGNDSAPQACGESLLRSLTNSSAVFANTILVGKWDSPRRTYVFKANGKFGSEGDSINQTWKIEGN
jgi:hypothetical protein